MLFSTIVMRFGVGAGILASSVCIATYTATEVLDQVDYLSHSFTYATQQVQGTNVANVLLSQGSETVSILKGLAGVLDDSYRNQEGSDVYDKEGQDDVITVFGNFEGIAVSYLNTLANAHETYEIGMVVPQIKDYLDSLNAAFDTYGRELIKSLPDDSAAAQVFKSQVDSAISDTISEYNS